jgi:prepilin-type N-terminal cleavage/methylation domain-containing protein
MTPQALHDRPFRRTPRWRCHSVSRRGFTLLELTVALLLFGIAMSGLFPLVVMYSRVLKSLEQRPKPLSVDTDSYAYRVANPTEWHQVPATPAAPNSGEWVRRWYLVPASDGLAPSSDAWARKLGADASVNLVTPANPTEVSLAEPTTADVTAWDAEVGVHYSDSADPAWTDDDPAATGAYRGNQRHPAAGNVATATWTFTGVVAGWYRVEATGLVSPGPLPTGCNYKLSSDLGVTWGNPITPTNLTFGTSSTWQPLTTKYFSAGTVTVQLTTDTSGTVIADGLRIVRCSVQIQRLDPFTREAAAASVEIKPAVRPP